MKVSNAPEKAGTPNESLPSIWIIGRETVDLLRASPEHFFGYSAWLLVPVVLSVLAAATLPASVKTFLDVLLNDIVYIFLVLWATISMAFFAVKTKRHETTDDHQISRQAWAVLLPYTILSLTVSFLNVVGFILIIPGFLSWVWFGFAALSFAVGDSSIGGALAYSKSLSKNRFFLVATRLVQGSLLLGLLYACFLTPMVLFFSPNGQFDLATYLNTVPSLGEQLCYNGLDILFLPLSTAFLSVLYVHITSGKGHGQSLENT